ncbi:AAA family ATPase [Nocardia uniformis]|uniref:AAA family ATPase n=1 Tax=Nocardia uniformis TaxID=53432 RepID=A0A849CB48_9NOCA|nr:LuxR family transcriptional regulator [Nocardia uniformis]NNH70191.1 AAA family ATPase [Nocardia uniformis]
MLYGRANEMQHIDSVLGAARTGRSGALAIVAEPGEGKSALLRAAEERAGDGWRIFRCTGIDSESELPFAGLHLLLGSAVDRLDLLPGPQRHALGSALGLCPPDGTDRFLIGVATLSLLADLSAHGPVLCLIDDAHWLDRPSADALLFAARRLGAEGIVMLFAGRTGFDGRGLPELRPGPLDRAAAIDLLADRSPDLQPEVRDRVLREAAGNPLALLEFDRLDVASAPAGPLPLPQRLQAGYERHIAGQSESARAALLVAAAEETGDLGLVLGVLDRIGHTAAALAEAEASGMVSIADRAVTFKHPLQRSAAYHSAGFTQRLAVHAALAAQLDDDPVRRAWHLAAASTGPDETVAAALESAADHARERAGHASAATALERAAWLTPDPAVRGRRLTLAVETAAHAGRTRRAMRLADAAEQLHLRPVERARVVGARALIEFEYGSLRRAHQLMLDAAECVADVEPERAAWLLIEAGRIAWTAGDLVDFRVAYHRLAELSLGAAREPLLTALRGPLVMQTGDPAAGIVMIRANAIFGRSVPLEMISLRLAFGSQSALIGDMPIAREQLGELAALVCDRGMIGWYPAVACTLSITELILGRFREAELIAAQALRIASDIEQPSRVTGAEAVLAMIAAVRGDETRCRELAERNLRQAQGDFNAIDITHFHWALALLDLGRGRYEHALDRLQTLHEGPKQARGHWIDLLADLIEAAARFRRLDRATAALAEIETWAAALDTPWAEGLVLRCRGLLTGDGELFAKAMTLHVAADRRYDHARTALLYGEWLRRERRMSEARSPLRQALETFDRLGAVPWADHARAELRAAGAGTVPEPETDAAARLTPQELQVARLAAAGASNKEIAAQLFLSPKTVGHHLYRAFPKLGVSNRVELARLHLG